MAYVDKQPMSKAKVAAIGAVVALHVILLWALKNGLDYNAAMEVFEDLKTFDIKEEKPKEEEPPPPPPKQEDLPPPPPRVDVPPPVNAPPVVLPTAPPAMPVPVPQAPPPPPPPAPVAPPAPSQAKAATPKGNPASWVTTDDYPPAALREERTGVTGIAWEITTDGRVENCRVTSSSGSPDLDEAACKFVTRRGRYKPAEDQNGQPIASSDKRRVRWEIPKE